MEEKKNDLRKLSPQEEARFLEYMRAIEGEGPQTTLMELITGDGVQLPSPDDLNDEQVSAKLREVIHAIHNHGALLYSTDHLSDRELYMKLYEEILMEEYPIVPEGFPHACLIDLLGYGGDEKDDQIYLTYYADEETRQKWAREFNVRLPERAPLPFHRDESLPR
jgi:hypothetical protein